MQVKHFEDAEKPEAERAQQQQQAAAAAPPAAAAPAVAEVQPVRPVVAPSAKPLEKPDDEKYTVSTAAAEQLWDCGRDHGAMPFRWHASFSDWLQLGAAQCFPTKQSPLARGTLA